MNCAFEKVVSVAAMHASSSVVQDVRQEQAALHAERARMHGKTDGVGPNLEVRDLEVSLRTGKCRSHHRYAVHPLINMVRCQVCRRPGCTRCCWCTYLLDV